ncbi:MAG: ferric reductase-like transmembrane domain-containing protein [Tannerellaceae bacterium]|jgi:DMSO/TMAO reductase YedYZ heme-binding membrane subunit|nr:ferric reductase-like transmembrane domain-containing protein [Tannerellaceae bacterium]
MVKLLFDLVQFLYSAFPLITCVVFLALVSILLSKSIKKYAAVYYLVLGLPFLFVAIPFIGRMIGVETFTFNRIPFLGGILRDYIHLGTFGFPLLIIIMYIGALNPRIKWVKKLMSIRKELSIISGFPVFTHSLIRVSNNFPRSLQYFTHHEEYMETAQYTNELGLWFSNFSFVLGIVLLILFIPLWVTSFGSIRKRMGNVKWKKLQNGSYLLYALLFIHALGIQVGGLLNPRGGGNPQRAAIENTQAPDNKIATENIRNRETAAGANKTSTEPARPTGRERMEEPSRGGQSMGFSDIKVSPHAQRYIHISSLMLIFGSYLYLRLRKARLDAAKRTV